MIFKKKNSKSLIILLVIFTFVIFLSFEVKSLVDKHRISNIREFSCLLEKKIRRDSSNKFFHFVTEKMGYIRSYCYDVLVSSLKDNNKKKDFKKPIIIKPDKINKNNIIDTENLDNQSWIRQGSNNFSNNYSSLEQININNVKKINKIWNYSLGETNGKNIEASPVFYNGVLYFIDFYNNIIALNIEDGSLKWKKKISADNLFIARRGITIDKLSKSLFVPMEKGVVALRLLNGEINKDIGKEGFFGNSDSSLISPIVTKDYVFLSEKKNSTILKFEKKNGKKVWERSLLKNKNFKGALLWSGISYDDLNNLLFIVTGNSKGNSNHLGTTREGDNLYANSLLALDGENGKIKWYFQDTKHDLWNFDLAFPPIISYIKFKNKNLKIVNVVGKGGNIYTFKIDDGKKLFSSSLIQTSKSKLNNEVTASSQLINVKPKRISSQKFSNKDISNFSVASKLYLEENLKNYISGDFLPPEINKNLIIYGSTGGGQWFGGSVGTDGILYLSYNFIPFVIEIVPKKIQTSFVFDQNSNGKKKFDKLCSGCHGVQADYNYNQLFREFSVLESKKNVIMYKKNLLRFINGEDQNNTIDYSEKIKIPKTYYGYKNEKNIKNTPSIIGSFSFKFQNDKKKYFAFLNEKYPFEKKDLIEITNYLTKRDAYLIKNKLIKLTATHTQLKDQFGNLGNKPPWSKIIAVDLNNQKILWSVPHGNRKVFTDEGEFLVKGSPAWSGLITTKSGVIISASSFEPSLDFYDKSNGNLLRSIPIEYAASATPLTVMHRNKQYVVLMLGNGNSRIDSGNLVSVYALN